jgi:RNA-directed DNA polymerase
MRHVQATIRAGHGWVVDMDLQSFFDRVNHDRLMARLKSRCPDADVLRLVNRFLKAGVVVDGKIEATPTGVPQGGPLSPVLANVVLDELDWELDRRGHRFRPLRRRLQHPGQKQTRGRAGDGQRDTPGK